MLHPAQSGFWATYSTESALLEVSEANRECLDAGRRAALVMLDLSAACDTVPHSLLLDRLSEIGISGSVWGWIRSFLEGRSQQVWLPPCASAPQSKATGVPQGSSLSPLLFNIYVTPLVYLVETLGAKVMAYANDTQLLFSWGRDDDSVLSAQHCLSSVFHWLVRHRVSAMRRNLRSFCMANFLPTSERSCGPRAFPCLARRETLPRIWGFGSVRT